MCNHNHTKEHVAYLEGYGDTETDSGAYMYTLKFTAHICVNCLFMVHERMRRVIFLVLEKDSATILRTYALKGDAVSYADSISGQWAEAEVVGS